MPSIDAILRANPDYVDSLYRRWLEDPESVDPTWGLFFAGVHWGNGGGNGGPRKSGDGEPIVLTARGALPEGIEETAAPALQIYDAVHTFREFGHLIARLDPLGRNAERHPLLELSEFGFTEDDFDRVVECHIYRGMQRGSLGAFMDHLRDTYCGTIGIEYMEITDKSRRDWLQERMEPVRNHPPLEADHRRQILSRLVAADTFEETIHRRYPGAKRFSLEGGTTLIPLLLTMVEEAAGTGARNVVMGMAHRGRLNVLAHVLEKPYAQILSEFEDRPLPPEIQGYGDVKYHLGYSNDHECPSGDTVRLTLAFNPSHLEAVDPVVQGIVRAKQNYLNDSARRQVIPILMHGDAAFAAQGVVAETMALSGLDAYRTGGTIHVIINNQVGFTTDPREGRSTRYATDIAKIVQAPVFHVNGDDPEAVVHVARLALGYRQTFGQDVVVDLVCFRRHGHNELDDPTFTQPLMYRRVKGHPSNSQVYETQLTSAGVVSKGDVDGMRDRVRELMEDAQVEAKEMHVQSVGPISGAWEGLRMGGDSWGADTAVSLERLERIARALVSVPEGFRWHRRLKRLMEQRAEMVLDRGSIDWGCGEALAIGSLLLEGHKVRLAGQDSVRGTFSHRHAIYFDAVTGEPHIPLNHIDRGQNTFQIINSPLSELAALGFEYGYSTADPRTVVVWEAQFGDFANAAQVVIDQFIASGEAKWLRMSGIVLLLPHGYEGQGPEHSSARLERFLELCAGGNIQVCNLTTPAQLFHALRRQLHREFRKPLVIMAPKSLLRHRSAVSEVADFTDGRFREIVPDPAVKDFESVDRVLVCSGKVYFTLVEAGAESGLGNPPIVRVEQLYPFPEEELKTLLSGYPALRRLVWVQEEPRNMGAWRNVRHRLERILPEGVELEYVGRRSAASPATGSHHVHEEEEAALIEAALAR